MQAQLDGFLLIAFVEDVSVRYYGLETERFLKFSGRNWLDARVDYGEEQRRFHCAAFGFQFADSPEQVFFFCLETQSKA